MFSIPPTILKIIDRLETAGYRAYLVGGAVRDLFLEKEPLDWDISTSARPEEVVELFPEATGVGIRFGTSIIPTEDCGPVEVTTFRKEGPYSDGRRPDFVEYTGDLATDLRRRDFTCNALAYHPREGLVDLFGGTSDLKNRVLRAVGDPHRRLQEDALRILRAFRFQTSLGLALDRQLAAAICAKAPLVANLPSERIGKEMQRLLEHPGAWRGIRRLRAAGLLRYILPELVACYGLEQNPFHAYSVYSHTLVALKHAADDWEVRTAVLLHDLGKAQVEEVIINGCRRFWGHQDASAEIAEKVLTRWAWPAKSRERIVRLVKEHMFYWPQSPTDRALRRFIAKIGPELVLQLLEVRKADIIGLGPKGKERLGPWNRLKVRIQEMLNAENVFSLKDLAVDGNLLMKELGLSPGPVVGRLLGDLFEAVLAQEVPNEPGALITQARKLLLSDE
ncbi:MAG: HD domain-containing protein [Firmicutes bacterium]|nr:HD domain-containing protein [Bacillota bacterium]